MRWERLFGDLSGLADDHEKLERDALAGEVRDEQWSDTSWADLLVSARGVEVAGLGRISGQVETIGAQMFAWTAQVHDHPTHEYLVSLAAVRAVVSGTPTSAQMPQCRHRQMLRQWARDGDAVQVTDLEGSQRTGTIGRVGKDFLLLGTNANSLAVPLTCVAAISRFR